MKKFRLLLTAKTVVKALGGIAAVRKLTGANDKQAWNWIGRSEGFPACFHECMRRELNRRGYDAPARLWNQKGLDKAA
jgi:hypothetical protein